MWPKIVPEVFGKTDTRSSLAMKRLPSGSKAKPYGESNVAALCGVY